MVLSRRCKSSFRKEGHIHFEGIPSSKIGVDSFIKVCDVDAFDSIIADWDCVEDQIAAIEERGVEITVVEEPK